MNLLTLVRRTPSDTYANRCQAFRSGSARCYRDLDHPGDHMHVNDKSYTVEWSQ